MDSYTVTFLPLDKRVTVDAGATLLEAAHKAGIVIDSVCGGDGICGRCKMVLKKGKVRSETTALLTREEVRSGVVLGCQSCVIDDLVVEIPEETRAGEKIDIDRDAQRFRAGRPGIQPREFRRGPLVSRVFLRLDTPTLDDNLADCQRLKQAVGVATGVASMQAGLKTFSRLPRILREHDFEVTALLGHRRDIVEIIDIEGGNTSARNYAAIVDIGTSTIVAHLVDIVNMATVDAEACFNGQSVYGREVTARIMAAEEKGGEELQKILVKDVNGLISALAGRNNVSFKDITAVVCSGNTTMMHFLLGLPTENIRRKPYIPATVEPPPLRAAEVGIKINPRGLIFSIPAIGGWIGGDITAGILATSLDDRDGIGMLIDIGTNGEIVVGNREWLMACSASTGPALEGASVENGMMARNGAIERVYAEGSRIRYKVIGDVEPQGLCGSAIIDTVAVLLRQGIIDRAGQFVKGRSGAVRFRKGRGRYVLAGGLDGGREICLAQDDIDNVITAKAAVFAATKIMLERLNLRFSDIDVLFLAGGFGGYIERDNAVEIGLLPDIPMSRVRVVGNTSIWGATLAAFSEDAYRALRAIRARTTYYDLMGSADYVEEFEAAMFLPHTDIQLFPSVMERRKTQRTVCAGSG